MGRDRQGLAMCSSCRRGSSCLTGRQDAVLLVSIVLLRREITYFISEQQQDVESLLVVPRADSRGSCSLVTPE